VTASKKARVVETPPDGSQYWASEVAWYALLAALVLSPLAPNASGLYSGMSFTKDLIIRSLVSVSLVFWGYAALRGHASVRWHRAAWLAAAFAAWAAICVLFSVAPGTALIGTWPGGEAGWLAIASCITAAFLTLQLADRSSRIRGVSRTVAITGAVVAGYGLLQTLGLDPLDWVVAWGGFRSFGTLGNPDMFGAYMVLAFPLTIGLVLAESDRRWKYAMGVAFVLTGTAIFTSLTRSAWLGALAGTAGLVALLWALKPKLGRFEVILACALVVSVAAFAVASLNQQGADSNAAARVGDIGTDRNSAARLSTWRAAGEAIAERPIVGWGPDTFQLAFEAHRTQAFSEIVDPSVSMTTAHNWVLQTAVEVGVVGLALLVGFLSVVAVVSARWVRRGPPGQLKARLTLAGVWAACTGFLVTSLLTPGSPPSRLLFWCLLAVLLSPQASRVDASHRVTLRVASAAALALGVVGVVLAAVVLSADAKADTGADVNRTPDVRADAADAAVATNPLCASVK